MHVSAEGVCLLEAWSRAAAYSDGVCELVCIFDVGILGVETRVRVVFVNGSYD